MAIKHCSATKVSSVPGQPRAHDISIPLCRTLLTSDLDFSFRKKKNHTYQASPEKKEEQQPESVRALSVNDRSPFPLSRNTISTVLKWKKDTKKTQTKTKQTPPPNKLPVKLKSTLGHLRFGKELSLALWTPNTGVALSARTSCAAPAPPRAGQARPRRHRGHRSGPALTCCRPPRPSMLPPGRAGPGAQPAGRRRRRRDESRWGTGPGGAARRGGGSSSCRCDRALPAPAAPEGSESPGLDGRRRHFCARWGSEAPPPGRRMGGFGRGGRPSGAAVPPSGAAVPPPGRGGARSALTGERVGFVCTGITARSWIGDWHPNDRWMQKSSATFNNLFSEAPGTFLFVRSLNSAQ